MQYAVSLTLDTNGSYWVQCRDLPELNSVGYSIDEALNEAADGIETVFMIYQDECRKIPAPSAALTGEYLVSLPESLIAQVDRHNKTLGF